MSKEVKVKENKMSESKIVIKPLEAQNAGRCAKFIVEGMNISKYIKSKKLQYLYSKFMFYQEFIESTDAFGVYVDNEFAGFILAGFDGMAKPYVPFKFRLYSHIFNLSSKLFDSHEINNSYKIANRAMKDEFLQRHSVDGEIKLFAVSSQYKGHGLGTKLLDKLATLHTGKNIYVYSDSNCDYQFYLHRGFEQVGIRQIVMGTKKYKIPLTCYMFYKTL